MLVTQLGYAPFQINLRIVLIMHFLGNSVEGKNAENIRFRMAYDGNVTCLIDLLLPSPLLLLS